MSDELKRWRITLPGGTVVGITGPAARKLLRVVKLGEGYYQRGTFKRHPDFAALLDLGFLTPAPSQDADGPFSQRLRATRRGVLLAMLMQLCHDGDGLIATEV